MLIRKIIGDPLTIFFMVGGLIFALYYANGTARDSIDVSDIVIQKLWNERSLVLDRPLTDQERTLIVDSFIDQEILLREAVAQELHLRDGKVRHRLADKMMYLISEEPSAPTEAELNAFYTQHKATYQTPPLMTFDHAFFASKKSALEALERSTESSTPLDYGDKFWLGNTFERVSAQDVISVMGINFALKVEKSPESFWAGPIESSRGWHLVRVIERINETPIPRDELQQRLTMEWMAAQRDADRAQALSDLRAKYEIKVSNDI